MVELVNIHDPLNHNIGTRTRRVTQRYADTEHSTGVPNNIDYTNATPNYQEMVVEPELTRPQYEELMNTLEIHNNKSIKESQVNTIAEVQVTDVQMDCGICLYQLSDGETCKELPCNHLFHIKCLKYWLVDHGGTNCPVCRGAIFLD